MYIQNIFILQTFCVLFINDAVTSILYLQILHMDVFQVFHVASSDHYMLHLLRFSTSLQSFQYRMLIKSLGGKKVLDVGVYTGASSLGAALALPDGKYV